tara:strand:+ start:340 stop:1416 length:1077 start_codon:yes stop_codon:yes gene_type:complete
LHLVLRLKKIDYMKILVTGGAGFIGSSLIRKLLQNKENQVINIDKLTYSGNLDNLKLISNNKNYFFYKSDICDEKTISKILLDHNPNCIFHLAAESHVDRSIAKPYNFMISNIMGTYHLLEATRDFYNKKNDKEKNIFRFIHVSTDEIYGELKREDEAFTEESQIAPNSPYSASKASSNHIARSYYKTYGLPITITNCSNNYGPYQNPEKLIPRIIMCALNGNKLPVYGKGEQIRDWIYVDDHSEALIQISKNGNIGENYNIGSQNEICNLDLVKKICYILDEKMPEIQNSFDVKCKSFFDLISFVDDRPGHDFRYAINSDKIYSDIGWKASKNIDDGLLITVQWYLNNSDWLKDHEN